MFVQNSIVKSRSLRDKNNPWWRPVNWSWSNGQVSVSHKHKADLTKAQTSEETTSPDNNNNNSSKKNSSDTTVGNIKIISSTGDLLVVAIPSGIVLLLGIIVVIGCIMRKRPERKQEEMNADENPVYGVYQLTEAYERQYSTNEAVDYNDYYEQ